MIRFIAAIDSKRGLADEKGIPWNLPADKKYYHDKITGQTVLVGKGTYHEARPTHRSIVASLSPVSLAPGDVLVSDAVTALRNYQGDIWVIGGSQIFAATINQADELYLTLVEGDFNCTKFFPEYKHDFECIDPGKPLAENGITFRFTVWRRKQ
jgi:dihydrofolate reductase